MNLNRKCCSALQSREAQNLFLKLNPNHTEQTVQLISVQSGSDHLTSKSITQSEYKPQNVCCSGVWLHLNFWADDETYWVSMNPESHDEGWHGLFTCCCCLVCRCHSGVLLSQLLSLSGWWSADGLRWQQPDVCWCRRSFGLCSGDQQQPDIQPHLHPLTMMKSVSRSTCPQVWCCLPPVSVPLRSFRCSVLLQFPHLVSLLLHLSKLWRCYLPASGCLCCLMGRSSAVCRGQEDILMSMLSWCTLIKQWWIVRLVPHVSAPFKGFSVTKQQTRVNNLLPVDTKQAHAQCTVMWSALSGVCVCVCVCVRVCERGRGLLLTGSETKTMRGNIFFIL